MSSAAAPDLSAFGLEPPISPAQVGGLRTTTPTALPPAPVAAPEPEPVVEARTAEQPPTPAPTTIAAPVQVQVRLSTGERISVGSFPSQDAAKSKARQMTRELEESRVWPFLAGRYIRPDAIVSIDLDLTAF